MKEGSTTIATFEYDFGGRRTEKVAAGLTHQHIYDADDIVEERISTSGYAFNGRDWDAETQLYYYRARY